jgi:Ca2+-binding RTX toxin-like protein
MTLSAPRRLCVALVLLALATSPLSPVIAQSETATATTVRREDRTIVLRGGSANSSFNFGTGLFANGIEDYRGRLVAGRNCEQSDRHTVSCGPSTAWSRVRGSLGAGNDSIGTIIPVRFTGVFGGLGRDRFYGDSRGDRFLGGPGDDLLKGFGGADYLAGGKGADVLRCGPGRDVAVADRSDRVVGCEVRR